LASTQSWRITYRSKYPGINVVKPFFFFVTGDRT
jgi:hypothetical protein